MKHTRHIAIIGAGWAGLAAAVHLTQQGVKVSVFERSPRLGGRASLAYAAGSKAPFSIDNGQHVLIGAYSHTLALLKSLDVPLEQAFHSVPAQWLMPGKMHLTLPKWTTKLPWLWHGPFKQIPIALGLIKHSRQHGHSLVSTLISAIRMQYFQPHSTETVDNWLTRIGCHPQDIAWLWQPLCAAALNTPSNKASAFIFWHVIRDGLMAGPKAASMLLPINDLGQLLPAAAQSYLIKMGVEIFSHCPVDAILQDTNNSGHWLIHGQPYSEVIIATAANDALRLLTPHQAQLSRTCFEPLNSLLKAPYEPITTVHLHVGLPTLAHSVYVLPDASTGSDEHHVTQDFLVQNAVLIDRGHVNPQHSGWVTVVLSSSHTALTCDRTTLNRALLQHLYLHLPNYPWPSHCEMIVIHAKQATHGCIAGITQPSSITGLQGVVLAGDYVAHSHNYPATLEATVRSGIEAAQTMLKSAA